MPGTEALAGRRFYAFHFRQFLSGSVGITALSLAVAGALALADLVL